MYPWIDILAAVGLVALAGYLVAWLKNTTLRVAILYGTLLVIVLGIWPGLILDLIGPASVAWLARLG